LKERHHPFHYKKKMPHDQKAQSQGAYKHFDPFVFAGNDLFIEPDFYILKILCVSRCHDDKVIIYKNNIQFLVLRKLSEYLYPEENSTVAAGLFISTEVKYKCYFPIIAATPIPPAVQMDTSALPLPASFSIFAACATILAPVAAKG